jgi:hypothetical protein
MNEACYLLHAADNNRIDDFGESVGTAFLHSIGLKISTLFARQTITGLSHHQIGFVGERRWRARLKIKSCYNFSL